MQVAQLESQFVLEVGQAIRNARALAQQMGEVGSGAEDSARIASKALDSIEKATALTTAQVTKMVQATKTAGMAQFATDLDKAAGAAQRVERAAKGAGEGLDSLGRRTSPSGPIGLLTREMHRADEATTKLGKSLAKVGSIATVTAIAAVGKQIRTYWIEGVRGAADEVDRLDLVLKRIGANAGVLPANLDSQVQGIKQAGIQLNVAYQSLTQAMQQGIDVTKTVGSEGGQKPVMEALARTAQNAAVISGQNSSETLSGLIHGIVSGQTDVIRFASGLSVSFEAAYQRMAVQMRKSVSSLTEAEKAQARMNEVIRAGVQVEGAYEASLDNAGKRLKSLERTYYELSRNMGQVGYPVFQAQVRILEQWVKAIEAGTRESTTFGIAGRSMAVDIGRAMLRVNDSFTETIKGFDFSGFVTRVREGISRAAQNKDVLAALFGGGLGAGMASARNALAMSPLRSLAGFIPAISGAQGAIAALILSNEKLRAAAREAIVDVLDGAKRVAAGIGVVAMAIQGFIDDNADTFAAVIKGVGSAVSGFLSGLASLAPVAAVAVTALSKALGVLAPLIEAVSGSGVGTALLASLAALKAMRALSAAATATDPTAMQRGWLGLSRTLGGVQTAASGLAGAMRHPGDVAEAAAGRARRAWEGFTGSVGALSGSTLRAAQDQAAAANAAVARAQAAVNRPLSVGMNLSQATGLRARSRNALPGLMEEAARAEAAAAQAQATQDAARRALLSSAGRGGITGGMTGAIAGSSTTSQATGAALGATSGAMVGMMAGPVGAGVGAAAGGIAGAITAGLRRASEASRKAAEDIKQDWQDVARADGAVEAVRRINVEMTSLQARIDALGGTGGAMGRLAKMWHDITGMGDTDTRVQARQLAEELKAQGDAVSALEAGVFGGLHDAYNLLESDSKKVEREAKVATETLAKILGYDDTKALDSLNLTARQMQIVSGIASEMAQRMKQAGEEAAGIGNKLTGVTGGSSATARGYLYQLLQSEANSARELTTLYDRELAQINVGRMVTDLAQQSGADADTLRQIASSDPAQLAKLYDTYNAIFAEQGKDAAQAYIRNLVGQRQSIRDATTAWTKEATEGMAKAGGTLKIDQPQAIGDAIKQIDEIMTRVGDARKKQQDALLLLDQRADIKGGAYDTWRAALAKYDMVSRDVTASAGEREEAKNRLAQAQIELEAVAPDGLKRVIGDATNMADVIARNEAQAAAIDKAIESTPQGVQLKANTLATQAATDGGANTANAFADNYIDTLRNRAPDIAAATAAAAQGKAPAVKPGVEGAVEQQRTVAEALRSADVQKAALRAAYDSKIGVNVLAADATKQYQAALLKPLVDTYVSRGADADKITPLAAAQARMIAAQERVSSLAASRNSGLASEKAIATGELTEAQSEFVRLAGEAGIATGDLSNLGGAASAAAAALASLPSLGAVGGTGSSIGSRPGSADALERGALVVERDGLEAQRAQARAKYDSAVAAATAARDSRMQALDERTQTLREESALNHQRQMIETQVQNQRAMQDATKSYYRQLEDMAIDHQVSMRRMAEDNAKEQYRFARDLLNFRRTDPSQLLTDAIGRGAGGNARAVDIAGAGTRRAVATSIAGLSSVLDPRDRARAVAEASATITQALIAEAAAAAKAGQIGRDVASQATYVADRWREFAGVLDGTTTAALSLEDALTIVNARFAQGLGFTKSAVQANLDATAAFYALQRQTLETRALLTNDLLIERDRAAVKKAQYDTLNQYVDALTNEATALARVGKISGDVASIQGHVLDRLREAKALYPELGGTLDEYITSLERGTTINAPSADDMARQIDSTLSGALTSTGLSQAIDVEVAWRINEDSIERALRMKDQMVDAAITYGRASEDAARRHAISMERMAEDQAIAMQRMSEDVARALEWEIGRIEAARAQALSDYNNAMVAAGTTFDDVIGGMTERAQVLYDTLFGVAVIFAALTGAPGPTPVNSDGSIPRPGGKIMDSGGVLPPGTHLISNLSGQNEAVLTGQQWAMIAALANGGGGSTQVVNVERMEVETDNPRRFMEEALWSMLAGFGPT